MKKTILALTILIMSSHSMAATICDKIRVLGGVHKIEYCTDIVVDYLGTNSSALLEMLNERNDRMCTYSVNFSNGGIYLHPGNCYMNPHR